MEMLMNSKLITGIPEYLAEMVALRNGAIPTDPTTGKPWRWNSIEHFVLENGRNFIVASPPPKLRQGGIGLCLKNASNLAKRRPDLQYVEGYAISGPTSYPMFHAWCVDQAGVVYDPTWPDGREHFGVPLKLDFVLALRKKNKWLSGIDSPPDFPVLAGVDGWQALPQMPSSAGESSCS
jgi:hypothetical protein